MDYTCILWTGNHSQSLTAKYLPRSEESSTCTFAWITKQGTAKSSGGSAHDIQAGLIVNFDDLKWYSSKWNLINIKTKTNFLNLKSIIIPIYYKNINSREALNRSTSRLIHQVIPKKYLNLNQSIAAVTQAYLCKRSPTYGNTHRMEIRRISQASHYTIWSLRRLRLPLNDADVVSTSCSVRPSAILPGTILKYGGNRKPTLRFEHVQKCLKKLIV